MGISLWMTGTSWGLWGGITGSCVSERTRGSLHVGFVPRPPAARWENPWLDGSGALTVKNHVPVEFQLVRRFGRRRNFACEIEEGPCEEKPRRYRRLFLDHDTVFLGRPIGTLFAT